MKKALLILLGFILGAVTVVALAGMYKFNYLASKDGHDADGNKLNVVDFESCLQANGGMVAESYPRQCFWEDMGFIEDISIEIPPANAPSDYVGLSTQSAQELAEENGVSFRVVERDGEPLPVTDDEVMGRINAVVKYGLVASYSVEGQEVIKDYVGLSIEEAEKLADQNGVPFRIVERDGQPLAATMDYRPGRINAAVSGNTVTGYTVE